MTSLFENRKTLLSVLFLLLLIFLTRIQLLWEPFFHADEALFALSAKVWQNGGIPYVDFFETKPLGVYAFYSFAAWMSGNFPDIHMKSVHFLSMLWIFLTALTVGGIARRVYSPRASFWAALFLVLFSTFWGPDIIAVHIELVLLLPYSLTIFFLARPPSSLKFSHSFLSGLFASAAFLCKYQAGILLPIVFLYYWILLWRFDPRWGFKKAFLHSLSFFLGFLPLPLIMVAYLYRIGGLEAFYFWNFYGNFAYIRDGNVASSVWHLLVNQVFRHIGSTVLIWILGVLRFINFWKERRNLPRDRCAEEWLLFLWLFLTFIPVSVGKRFEDHYFLFLLPALSVLAAGEIASWSQEKWRRFKTAVIAAIVLPTLGFTITRYAMHPLYAKLDGEDMNSYKPYAQFLKERTHPGDRIFVWGCAPAVYLFADRWPAGRFFRTDVLAGRIAGVELSADVIANFKNYIVPGTWDIFFEELKRHPPQYIIDMAPTGLHDFRPYPTTNYPPLMEYLRQNYIEEPPFLQATVYRRKG